MQHIRQTSGNYFFSHAAPEAVLLLSRENLAYLADLQLSFWCEHSFPTNVLQTSAVSDLRVYLDGNDITGPIAKTLVNALRARPNARTEYVSAMERWIAMLAREAANLGLNLNVIEEQRRLKKKFAAQDWGAFFSKLKTDSYGYRGGLHPLHFVFREILIPPISLREALFPLAKDEEYPLSKVADPRLIISHGPCRFYGKDWTPVELQYQGNISVAINSVLDDAWEFEMRQRMSDIAVDVAGLSDRLLELKTFYLEFEKRAAEFKALATSIEASVQELTNP